MKPVQKKTKTGVEQLDKATEQLRKVVDEVVSKLEYVEDTGIEKVSDIADQVREFARELVEQRLGKADPAKETPDVSAVAEQLRKLAGELRGDTAQQRRVALAAVELLLAGPDILCSDTTKNLEIERAYLTDAINEIGEIDNSLLNNDLADAQLTIKDIEERLDMFSPVKQAAILHDIASRLPDKQTEYEAENAASEACDELINWIAHNKNDDEQKTFYEQSLAAVKAGNGVAALKASA
jgi:hypothetical protein